jgi:outer membrane protein assembly factor BamD (BamD/ComL family)
MEEAARVYKLALRRAPTEDTAAQAEWGLGYIYYDQGKYRDAEPYLEGVFQKRSQLACSNGWAPHRLITWGAYG